MTSQVSNRIMANTFLSNPKGGLYDRFHYLTVGFFDQHGDPRVGDYFMMRTPWAFFGVLAVYYWFVRYIGPKMMRNRKPYEITNLVRLYNLYLMAWAASGFIRVLPYLDYGAGVIGCRPVDPNQRDEKTLKVIYFGWTFVMSRLVELLDTVFFVLRKKTSQATKFHVFHHIVSPVACWSFLKFQPGGNSGIFPLLNAQVHFFMYAYYFMATFPALKPYLGWKKYLTQMQMIQFGIVIAVCLHPLFIPGCKFPRSMLIIMVLLASLFAYLFFDFYRTAYKKSNKQLQDQQRQQKDQQQLQQQQRDDKKEQ